MLADKSEFLYTIKMDQENRLHTRYEEIGRITAPEICALPGILDDISLTGCKVHYSFPVVVDLENEYDVKISPLHGASGTPLNLICTPQCIRATQLQIHGFQRFFQMKGTQTKRCNFIYKFSIRI